ncbi:ATP-dependent DNA helicase PIF1-like [Lucilia cuprina]|uniref:ATP-dependent DNA helicase PIF1-like n=1 Tax=Lucilia cuprina TaxID=7375 RepID=UPI001F056947|nr:ATP-dependent DNA helicase PIF1-like [Lucilia cuprina]
MVSSEAKLSDTVVNGVYHFKIHDIFYHRAGALTADCGRPPTYAQLYFYDVETANQYRMSVAANIGCCESLMQELADELGRVNAFVCSFKSMSEYCQRPENLAVNVAMVIKINKNADFRRFNDAIYTDVAAIFTTDDGEPPFERNMVTFYKQTSTLRAISVLDSSLDPLSYPLLFPNGDTACHARGIASNDNEWRDCLNEAKETQSPRQLRQLFAFICSLNVPTNALQLWNEFKKDMSEDFFRDNSENISYNRSLLEIEDILITHNLSCQQLGLPTPVIIPNQNDFDQFDPDEEGSRFNEMYESANEEQRNVIDCVMREVLHHDTGSNVYCLTANAGCGKTFIQTAIIHKMNSLNLKCIPTAFSGIASTLLIGGRTLHSVFKIPIPVLENSVSSITANSPQSSFINSASLIMIDEISMCPLHALKLIDRLLRDLSTNANRNTLFGGKTILLCGDFRQILPVIPHSSRTTLIENSVTSWSEFAMFHRVTLTHNMRALPHEIEFINFLNLLGNGDIKTLPQFEDVIEIPRNLVGNAANIIEDMFGNIPENISMFRNFKSCNISTKNEDCYIINAEILNLIPGEEKAFYSVDKLICDDIREANNYPTEYLNSLNVSGLPPHKLVLKENSIVLLIRNFNTKNGLIAVDWVGRWPH